MFPRTRRLLVVIGVLIGQPALHAWSPSLMGDRVQWAAAGAAQSCSYSLSATSASVSSTGTTAGSLSVVTGTNCSWTSVSHDAWITVTGGASGQGIGQVRGYSVAANTTGGQRVGTMTIAGTTYTVTQSATGCTVNLSATSASVPSTGSTAGALSVVTGTSCSWTAVSNAAWITVTNGASGTGIGQVAYTVAANTTGTQRVGTMTIAGQTFTVTQSGSGCTYSLSATSASVPSTGSTAGALSVVTRHELFMDGGQQRRLDHRHERRERIRNRPGRVHRRGKHDRQPARRHDDHRRADLHGYPEWRQLHLQPLGDDVVLGRLDRQAPRRRCPS